MGVIRLPRFAAIVSITTQKITALLFWFFSMAMEKGTKVIKATSFVISAEVKKHIIQSAKIIDFSDLIFDERAVLKTSNAPADLNPATTIIRQKSKTKTGRFIYSMYFISGGTINAEIIARSAASVRIISFLKKFSIFINVTIKLDLFVKNYITQGKQSQSAVNVAGFLNYCSALFFENCFGEMPKLRLNRRKK